MLWLSNFFFLLGDLQTFVDEGGMMNPHVQCGLAGCCTRKKLLSTKEKYKQICNMRAATSSAAPSSSSNILKLHESSGIKKILH